MLFSVLKCFSQREHHVNCKGLFAFADKRSKHKHNVQLKKNIKTIQITNSTAHISRCFISGNLPKLRHQYGTRRQAGFVMAKPFADSNKYPTPLHQKQLRFYFSTLSKHLTRNPHEYYQTLTKLFQHLRLTIITRN